MNRQISAALDRARELGELGVQVAAYHRGELIVDAWSGQTEEGADGRPVDGETLFPVFSVTKAVTATALHIQAERGLIEYDGRVAEYWPEYGVEGKDATTVRDVLTHRSGAPQMPDGVTTEQMCDWDWMVTELAAQKPIFPPGTVNAYHSISWGWLVGELVRRCEGSGRSFSAFIREEITEPLGITDLYVGLPASEDRRVATLVNGLVATEVPAEATALRARTMPPGAAPTPEIFGRPDVWRAEIPGAGGIMTARAGARFFAMIAGGGELDGRRLLSAERLRSQLALRPEAAAPDRTSGVPRLVGVGGYWLGGISPPADPVYGLSTAVLGHAGAGGANGWADLDQQLAIVVCHNRMFNADAVSPQEHPFIPLAESIRGLAAGAQKEEH